MDVPVAAEFLVLASALLEIKSKMLLPRTAPDEDGVVTEDPRSELVEKLLEYKQFKQMAEILQRREEMSMNIVEKPQEDLSEYVGEADEYLSLDLKQFVAAFEQFLHKKKKVEEAPATPTTKICPFCKSEIAIEATRCAHCTSVLEEN
jgi:segregation and condensation protein A